MPGRRFLRDGLRWTDRPRSCGPFAIPLIHCAAAIIVVAMVSTFALLPSRLARPGRPDGGTEKLSLDAISADHYSGADRKKERGRKQQEK